MVKWLSLGDLNGEALDGGRWRSSWCGRLRGSVVALDRLGHLTEGAGAAAAQRRAGVGGGVIVLTGRSAAPIVLQAFAAPTI